MSGSEKRKFENAGHFVDAETPKLKRNLSAVNKVNANKVPFSHIFMNFAMQLSNRTADVNTGVGCVLVNTKNNILGFGYNGESRDTPALDANLNMNELMVHAEMNALAHATVNLMKEDIYVFTTRQPCEHCMKCLAQYNIKGIFYLVYSGYKSFMVAESKKIPMVQYDRAFKISLENYVKDKSHTHNKDQKIILSGNEIQYKEVVVMSSSTSNLCGKENLCVKSNICPNHQSVMFCQGCLDVERNKRIPKILYLPLVIYEQWTKDFKIKEQFWNLE